MTLFWLLCALMVLAALAILLRPLLRQERAFAVTLAVLVPLLSVALYFQLGDPRVFDPAVQSVTAAMQQARQDGMPPMEQAIAGLRDRLACEPGDLEGWLLLGRAYKTLERFDDSTEAFSRALALAPESASVMVEYAEARTLASPSRRFEGEPLELLDRALQIEPDNQRGLWLRGIAHYQSGDTPGALAVWEHLLAVIPEDSPTRESLRQRIAELTSNQPLGSTPAAAASAEGAEAKTGDSPAPDATTPRLTVKVSLAPSLAGKMAPDDTLFVYARAPQGSRAPLAIQRLAARDLPLTVTLDDSHAMVPQMNLSSAARVVVGARISRSGSAQAQPGDLETLSPTISTSRTEPVELVIDRIAP